MLKTFETEICSRCHGTGKYSFCEEYGDKCFKCGGNGHVLSKRGSTASRYFTDLCQVPISALNVGDVIRVDGITQNAKGRYSYKAVVTKIERSQYPCTYSSGSHSETYFALVLFTEHPKYGAYSLSAKDTNMVRVYRQDDTSRMQKALEYQDKLTKTGTVKKAFKDWYNV